MNYLEAVLLGIIQGVTEFLPISSSGHLEIGKTLFGNELVGEEGLFLTLVLHLGTALSTTIVFRKEIQEIFNSLLEFKLNENTLFFLKIIISMIPASLVGIFLQNQIEILFSKNLILVGTMLMITAVLLFLADRASNTHKQVTFSNAFVLGLVQAIAILPGISRSGSTIAIAVLVGIDREKAAKFSFLMVLPLIFGSMVKTFIDMDVNYENSNFLAIFFGFITAFFSGIIACKWMISLVKKSKLKFFSFYCISIGLLTILYGFL